MQPAAQDQEYVRCNLCRADEPTALFEGESLPDGRPTGVVRCAKCGLVYRNARRRPDREKEFYASSYAPGEPCPDWIASRQRFFLRAACALEAFRKTGRVLDVGAGHGFFLQVCRERGWQGFGVEPSRQGVEYAMRKFGLDLFPGTFDEARFPEASFDGVTLWNLLDQLPDPRSALDQVMRLLRPGGAVLLRFPNASFHLLCHRFFGGLARLIPAVRRLDPSVFHLYAFDRRTMKSILEAAGFERVMISNSPLTGTTRPEEPSGLARQLGAPLLELFAALLSGPSGKRLLLAPSLFVVAVKPGGGPEW